MSTEVNDRKRAQHFYNSVKEWQSETNSSLIDLLFFQRILDIYGLKAMDPVLARDVEILKRSLVTFLEQTAETHKRRLREHEGYLQRIVEDRVLLKDRDFPYRHKDVEKEVESFRQTFWGLKNELFAKVEHLKNV
jgi:hypothetical protein